MLNIALPTGRMGEKAYRCFADIGYACPGMENQNRKLVFVDEKRGLRYMLVKPKDVAMYVEYGAADIGVVGRDVIMESQPDIYELLDLEFGKCASLLPQPEGGMMILAGLCGWLLLIAMLLVNISLAWADK